MPLAIVWSAFMAEPEKILEHPNRETAASKSTRAIVIALLLISAFLVAVITVGGWDVLTGGRNLQIVYVAIYLLLAYYVSQWRSGMLPLTAALAAILLIFAAVAAPAWFARDADGFTDPMLSAGLLGLLTAVLIPVQLLLIAFAMRGFSQQWHVEVERMPDGSTRSASAWA
ncbi:hypothetical protein LRS13_14470 [Svornostia abyssi]|uniref:Uncharacterized protein n=1 Tax=Svornostia abyssi TaxID=2898438 RepID=A0ABY5PBR9_9ACTN|nr:hypothetical protein LRS13_14470 [Parviterribacteraceae bacterium J379]